MKKGRYHLKRILALLMALLLVTLTACSSEEEPQSSSSAPVTEQTETAPPETESQPEEEEEPAADNSWQFDTRENHQMDPEVFDDLHTALAGTEIYAAVTVKDGVIIDEYYKEGYDETSVFPLHSASKSFTSALLGIAMEQGYIGSVDDLLSEYLPQVSQLEEGKQQLTLRHLLTQTSGLEWYEWGSGYSNWVEFRTSPNWVDYILGRDLVAQPGTVFNYSTGNTHLISAALEAATGRNQLEFGKEYLFDPLGIESVQWGTDPQGITDGGNGISMTARDAARFGQLYLQGGQWNGQQLVPADWVKESTTAQNRGAGDSTGSYGYQWWVTSFATGGYGTYATPYPTAQYDAYFAFGHGGQIIYVVPQLELVTVFTCGGNNSYVPRPFFTDYILNAYTG